jgi:signal peptidase II
LKSKLQALLWPAVGVVVLDQATKAAILKGIPLHASVPVVNGLFSLVHVRNRGMAFGLFNRPDGTLAFFVLTAASLLAMLLLIVWYRRLAPNETWIVPALGLVLGGAAGNLIDRLRLGEVVDFLDVYIGQWHWPAFNVADSAITVGTFWIALCLILQPKVRR